MIEPEPSERPRHACDLKVEVLLPDTAAGRHLGEGTLINIGPGEGSLSFPGPLLHGVRYTLKLTKPAVVALSCRVWLEAGGSGKNSPQRCFGLVFELSPEQEEVFASMLAIVVDREPPESGRKRSCS